MCSSARFGRPDGCGREVTYVRAVEVLFPKCSNSIFGCLPVCGLDSCRLPEEALPTHADVHRAALRLRRGMREGLGQHETLPEMSPVGDCVGRQGLQTYSLEGLQTYSLEKPTSWRAFAARRDHVRAANDKRRSVLASNEG